jgi:DNA repair protein RecO (recombination protein O)
MNLKKTQAIVLKSFPLTNSDMIITFFTPFSGKLCLIAKNAKKSIKRFGACLDLITMTDIEYSEKRTSDLGKLNNIDLIDNYEELKKNYQKIMTATYFIDLINNFYPIKLSSQNTYKLLSMTLTYMNTKADTGSILEAFQIKALCALGIKLNYKVCTKCNTPVSEKSSFKYSYSFNELNCHNCKTSNHYIHGKALSFIEQVSVSPIKDFLGIKAGGSYINELRHYVDFHIDSHLGRHLKSRDLAL